jgi:hypothetical protein
VRVLWSRPGQKAVGSPKPRVASEPGLFGPQHRTCGNYIRMSSSVALAMLSTSRVPMGSQITAVSLAGQRCALSLISLSGPAQICRPTSTRSSEHQALPRLVELGLKAK